MFVCVLCVLAGGGGGEAGGVNGTLLGGFSLVNSCSCMQMQANIFKIYPVETLPSMESSPHCSIQEAVHAAPESSGWGGVGGWGGVEGPHTVLDLLIRGEIPPSLPPSPLGSVSGSGSCGGGSAD